MISPSLLEINPFSFFASIGNSFLSWKMMDSLALMNEERGKREKVHRRIFKRDTIDSDRPKKSTVSDVCRNRRKPRKDSCGISSERQIKKVISPVHCLLASLQWLGLRRIDCLASRLGGSFVFSALTLPWLGAVPLSSLGQSPRLRRRF